MGNVVIVTHWLDGDVIPFIRIGKELKRRGHPVTLITHCYFEEMAKKAGLRFRSWDTPEEYAELVDEMQGNKTDSSKEKSYSYEASSFRQKYESIETRLKEYRIINECCDSGTVILCKNRSSVAAYMVAEKNHLPLATVMMNPTEIPSMLLYEQLEGDHDLPRLNELRKDVELDAVDSWLQWESSAKMTLALWPEWYDGAGEGWPAKIETVGFPFEKGKEAFAREIPADFSDWLSDHPKPIVITGGTTKCINEKFYESSIAACGLYGRPTVVLSRYREFLPSHMPENVIWYEYLPLDSILPETGLLIHHGGMGTLSGALAAGVPQMVLPCYVDRPYNASLLKKLGVGDYLYPANWEPRKIAEKLRELQDASVREICSQYMTRMRTNNGITVAADHVEMLMRDRSYVYSVNLDYKLTVKKKTSPAQPEKRGESREVLQNMSREQRTRMLAALRNKNVRRQG